MALKTKLDCIKTYMGESKYFIKEIEEELKDFNGYDSLSIMETKLDRLMEAFEIAKTQVMNAYDELEEE